MIDLTIPPPPLTDDMKAEASARIDLFQTLYDVGASPLLVYEAMLLASEKKKPTGEAILTSLMADVITQLPGDLPDVVMRAIYDENQKPENQAKMKVAGVVETVIAKLREIRRKRETGAAEPKPEAKAEEPKARDWDKRS